MRFQIPSWWWYLIPFGEAKIKLDDSIIVISKYEVLSKEKEIMKIEEIDCLMPLFKLE